MHIFGGTLDITDSICIVLFIIYTAMALKLTYEGFMWHHKIYIRMKSKQNYNLYNLIFSDTEFDGVQEDLSLKRYSSCLICLVSMFLLGLLFMPPRDEML